jgi:hypothetical protein
MAYNETPTKGHAMKNEKLTKIKNKTKEKFPEIIAVATVVAACTATIAYSYLRKTTDSTDETVNVWLVRKDEEPKGVVETATDKRNEILANDDYKMFEVSGEDFYFLSRD